MNNTAEKLTYTTGITLGELRERTCHLPDDVEIFVKEDGTNPDMELFTIADGSIDEFNSLILYMR